MTTLHVRQDPPAGRVAFLNVRDYGALGNGITNDAPAIQAALNAATGMLRDVYFPPGDYLLGSVVTLTDVSIQVAGSGIEVTRFLVNNPTGGLVFTSNGQTGAQGSAHHFGLSDCTFMAVGTGSQARGTALRVTYPGGPSAVPDTPYCTIERVSVRSQTYDSAVATQPYFTVGLHTQNLHNSRLSDIHVVQINNTVAPLLWLEYTADASAYRLTLRGLELLGGARGLKVTGWVENVQVSDFEIVGAAITVEIDGSTSNVQNPALLLSNGHMNGTVMTLLVTNWTDVHIVNCSLYLTPTSMTLPPLTALSVLRFVNSRDISVLGCRIGTGPLNPNGSECHLVWFANSTRFAVANNTFDIVFDQNLPGGCNGVQIGPSPGVPVLGSVQDNVFALNFALFPTGARGIVLSSPDSSTPTELTVTGNRFQGIDTGVVLSNPTNVLVANNVYVGPGVGVALLGTIGPQTIVRHNHPATRTQLTLNSATPSITGIGDGLATTGNTVATTITNFLGGHEGMRLEVLASNAQTTVAHNVNIILNQQANFVMTNGSILTLRHAGGVWREIARTTI